MQRVAVLLLVLAVTGADLAAQRRAGGPQDGAGGGAAAGGRGLVAPRALGPQTTATSVIQGFVMTADTGSPVRRAEVRATSSSTRTARTAVTDDDGRFVLSGLPAGNWTVTASKPGFVAQQFGQRRPSEVVAPIALAEDERRSLTFTLWRGGAITGRVSDEFGDPITGARLQVLRVQTQDGQRRLVAAGVTGQSDDRGIFRLYGLTPGEYYVTAAVRTPAVSTTADTIRLNVADVAERVFVEARLNAEVARYTEVELLREQLATVATATSYAPTYYPGTPHAGLAQRIVLTLPGEEVDATFSITPVQTVSVSGTVLTSAGTPGMASVTLVPMAGGDLSGPGGGTSGVARNDGNFTIAGVVPGNYLLNVQTRGAGGRGGGGAAGSEVASVPVSVGADGLEGLFVTTGPGGRMAGTVTSATGTAPPTGLQVQARAVRGGRSVQTSVSRDGTFAVSGLVGPYAIDVARIPQGWALEAILVNGVDVIDTPMEFRGTERVAGARIVLTDRLTDLTGTVTLRGQPTSEAQVVIFPQDPGRLAFPARYVRTAGPDAQGGFAVRGLPTGRYLAVAVNYLQQGEAQDRDFLERLRSRATSVTLTDAGRATVDLRVLER